ncbi:radical SAM protein [Shewanella bicestrii]|nr:radical SAM protein [Shewanella bicestrii]
MKSYKYYAGLTSQVGFCATPLRLDPYNRCQYSCDYCFASTRQGYGRRGELQIGNPSSLLDRLTRVYNGKVNSALDELIEHRVPFQLGGMSDPFTKLESKEKITLEYLKILKEFNYPVIISTKSDDITHDEYMDVISGSNIYVRFSTTIVNPEQRDKIDRGCIPIEDLAKSAKTLGSEGIPVCFRFQPIIPGHEKFFNYILDLAASSNVKHISAEYLKCPIDANKKFGRELNHLLGGNPIDFYKKSGATKQGREYSLPAEYRAFNLAKIAFQARAKGMTFGFADNDLLLHSDGNACCSASNLYLENSNYFTANIVSLAKSKSIGEKLYFEDYLSGWIPNSAISTYLNSKARLSIIDTTKPEWLNYLQEMWTGKLGVYNPEYFDGVQITDEVDSNNLPVFVRAISKYSDIRNLNNSPVQRLSKSCNTFEKSEKLREIALF